MRNVVGIGKDLRDGGWNLPHDARCTTPYKTKKAELGIIE